MDRQKVLDVKKQLRNLLKLKKMYTEQLAVIKEDKARVEVYIKQVRLWLSIFSNEEEKGEELWEQ